MLSHPLQYSPQSLNPQFQGVQAGFPHMIPALFGQPGVYNGNAQFGPESFAAHPLSAGPFATNPYLQNPSPIVAVLGQLAQQIAVQSAVAQQIGIAVHQLAHQLGGQGALGFQSNGFGGGQAFVGAGQPFGQPGAGQPFGPFVGGGQLFAGAGQPYMGGQPFAGAAQPYIGGGVQAFGPGGQGAYGGFGPQGQLWGGSNPQAWAANRQQTIQ